MGKLLTAVELADQLQIKPDTVKRWARAGLIPSLKFTGRVLRFDPETVDAALRHQAKLQADEGATDDH